MTIPPELQRKIREWFLEHYGLITRIEARKLGVSDEVIRHKLTTGEWELAHPGVFRDAHFPRSYYQDLKAAVVATRSIAMVSHQSGGWLLGYIEDDPEIVVLSIPRTLRTGLRLAGVQIHRSTDLYQSEPTMVRGLSVTNGLRTIVDLAGVLTPEDLTKVVDTALRKRSVTVAGLEAELGRLTRRGRPGVKTLRRHLLDRGFLGAPPASELETLMRRLLISAGIPMPKIELVVGPDGEYRLDFAWNEIRFAVEVDGYVWHFTPEHVQRDTNRRNALQDQGWTIRVYTWRDLSQRPAGVAHEIRHNYFRRLPAAAR